ncbi:MAG TPA: hypothetical protein VHX38_10830 [Pseudonocardiaceae bacterium]|jgi:hypothetical protein|nr:hypothetical protein [Pseudonocardiaceae bacterium]
MTPWTEDGIRAEVDYRRAELRRMAGITRAGRIRVGHRTGGLRKLLHRGQSD